MNVTGTSRITAIVVALILGLVGCGDSGDDGLHIVATTTIWGDVVSAVVGDAATVEVVLPVGADPHDYRPSAREAAALAKADVVIANGLGLEEGLEDVLAGLPNVVYVAEQLQPRAFGGEGLDPHVWLDPTRMADAAHIVARAVEEIDPDGAWSERADDYAMLLLELDEEISAILDPVGDRVLVTNHDSLGYFADRYSFEVVGTIVPGGASLAEPGSARLAELVEVIRTRGVKAIFAETTASTVLAETLAAEVGREVAVVELYTGSLGEPGSGAETLIGLLRTNAQRMAEALS